MEYEVVLGEGPLGVTLQPDLGDDMPPVVARPPRAGSAAALANVAPGHLLISINGVRTARLGYDNVVETLQSIARPATLCFRVPNTRAQQWLAGDATSSPKEAGGPGAEVDQAREREAVAAVVGGDASPHMLTPNANGARLTCRLCRLRGITKKAGYGCTKCLEGFHVECFTAFHYQGAFGSDRPEIRTALEAVCAAAIGIAPVKTRRRLNASITQVDQLQLPSE